MHQKSQFHLWNLLKLQISALVNVEKNDNIEAVLTQIIFPFDGFISLISRVLIVKKCLYWKSLTNYLLVISLNLYLVLIVFSGLLKGRDAVDEKKIENKLISSRS